MIDEFWAQILNFIKQVKRFVRDNTVGKFAIISTVVLFLIQIGVWDRFVNILVYIFEWLVSVLNIYWFNIPVYIWTVLFIWLLAITIFILWQYVLLQFASGVFTDDFSKGLSKWEFGNEGWKNEKENGKYVLSVSESDIGGISKRGFNWSDYEFSFETKVVHGSSGWIVRAENRTKYFMLQLNITDPDNPTLRPHLRVDVSPMPWVIYEGLKVNLAKKCLSKPIRLMEWVKVKIIVRSGEIDAYLNNEHAFHISLPDPIIFDKPKTITSDDGTKKVIKETAGISYPVGRVGFRCSEGAGEHAHFRNVRVKPLLS